MGAFDSLIRKGHSIIVIEHNLEVIKTSDWIIDLGPEGGDRGGYIMYEGIPEKMIGIETPTSIYLKEKLN